MKLSSRIVWRVTPPLVRVVARALWRLKFTVQHPLPEPPYVVAANHHSFLDPFLIGTVLDEPIRFIGLSDLTGHYRVVDFFIDAYDMIPVTRGKVPLGAIREALRHLDNGGVVGVFPEGTRHNVFDPSNALPGAAWLAVRAGAPLVTMAVKGSEVVLGVENQLRRGRIEVVLGPTLRAEGTTRATVDALTRRWGEWVAATLKGSGSTR